MSFRVASTISFGVIIIAAVAFFVTASGSDEVWHISDNNGGGDCLEVGTWDAGTKTCTLTRDVSGRFQIESDGVTLDGNGHALVGSGPERREDFQEGSDGGGDGVHLYRRTGVTVKNLKIMQFDYGVNLVESTKITVTGISTWASGLAGISLHSASGNNLSGNDISNPGVNTGICVGFASQDNIITGNKVTGNDRGVYLHTGCDGNTVSGNSLIDNVWGLTLFEKDSRNLLEENAVTGGSHGIYINDASNGATVRNNIVKGSGTGIRLENVSGASVYRNMFLDNGVQAELISSGAALSLPAPDGGNYWSSFDSEAEGCADVGGDGFCDNAFILGGARDNLPWVDPLDLGFPTKK